MKKGIEYTLSHICIVGYSGKFFFSINTLCDTLLKKNHDEIVKKNKYILKYFVKRKFTITFALHLRNSKALLL